MPQPARDSLQVERTLLCALCSRPLSQQERAALLRRLAEYNWRSPDHRVIYEALRRGRQIHSGGLRHHVIAEITRLGFPDIDLAPYFAPSTLSYAEIERLAEALLAAPDSEASDTK